MSDVQCHSRYEFYLDMSHEERLTAVLVDIQPDWAALRRGDPPALPRVAVCAQLNL